MIVDMLHSRIAVASPSPSPYRLEGGRAGEPDVGTGMGCVGCGDGNVICGMWGRGAFRVFRVCTVTP